MPQSVNENCVLAFDIVVKKILTALFNQHHGKLTDKIKA